MKISTITVVAGKLNVEPVAQPKGDLWAGMRRAKARYVSQSKKLQVPLKYFGLAEDGSLLEAVYCLLKDMSEQ